MKLHFLGANRQVTGSRYCLEIDKTFVMIDCGMFQERPFEIRNWDVCPIDPSQIAAMLLTHAHTDHCGLIPRLVNQGFSKPIYTTLPTVPLAEVILRDSADIQSEDAEYKVKRHKKEGRSTPREADVLFDHQDVDRSLPLMKGVPNGQKTEVAPGVFATFFEAGHILGSSSILVEATEYGKTRTILFSGDIGQWNKPIIRDPTLFKTADYVVMETTYGDRLHEAPTDVETQLANVISETDKRGGKVVIPTFALERAQELVYYFGRLVHAKRIPRIPIFLDSPMAIDVTQIFRNFREFYDEETFRLIASGGSPFQFPGLKFARTAQESIAINSVHEPCVIMSSSGMCTAGRIKHHLRNNIEDPKATILFVGHQGTGTLGRFILDGAKEVRIHGKSYRVKANIRQIYGFSGHADRDGLVKWISSLEKTPKRIFLTHGEEEPALAFGRLLTETHGYATHTPQYREVADLD